MVGVISAVLGGAVLLLSYFVAYQSTSWFVVAHAVLGNAVLLLAFFFLRCHPVFNVSALKKYYKNTIEGREVEPPPPITDLDGFQRFVVDKILSHRRNRRGLQYLVKWIGYHDATWEPERFLLNEAGQDLDPLKLYKAEHPHWVWVYLLTCLEFFLPSFMILLFWRGWCHSHLFMTRQVPLFTAAPVITPCHLHLFSLSF